MRRCLSTEHGEQDSSHWAALPALCCQAAGGSPYHADPVAAAWYLFYTAADIMDSVEDRDEPADWWAESGPGMAISAATGLYFSASLALNRLDAVIGDARTASDVRAEMLKKFLEMSAGQHLDLTHPQPSLDVYWRIAQSKSGAFFSMACWAGARLATHQPSVLEGYRQFGTAAGLLIQVLDDLHDYLELSQAGDLGAGLDLRRSLPAVFVREVVPESIREKLDGLLSKAQKSPAAAGEIIQMIEQYGGVLYVHTELDKLRMQALAGLDQADARPPARSGLESLLDELHGFD